jgi:outer membrane lipoprotein-sorting protein
MALVWALLPVAGPTPPMAPICSLLPFACSAAEEPNAAANLDTVLKRMDAASAKFRTAQADLQQERYEKVIGEVDDVQTGTIYFRRTGEDVEMKLDIKQAGDSATTLKPEKKFVLFSGGKIRMYLPKADQETDYDMGKNKSDFESYVVLGFGGSGQDLRKAFDVSYLGQQAVQGVATGELSLVPKSPRVRNNFSKILLWIDVDSGSKNCGMSVQQQFYDPQGDYRLAKYSNIRLNEKIPNDVFQLKTTGKTQIVSPHG